jgi:hypothetical protein
MVGTRALTFHMSMFFVTRLSIEKKNVDLVTLVYYLRIKTLALAITFENYVLELRYFIGLFVVTRLFHGSKFFTF